MRILGIALQNQDRAAEAEPLMRKAAIIAKTHLPPDSGRLESTYHSLIRNLQSQQKFTEALVVLRERDEDARNLYAANPEKLEEWIYDMADTSYRDKQYAEAERLYRELLQSREKRLPATHGDVIRPSASLARLLSDWAWTDRSQFPTGTPGTLDSLSAKQTAETSIVGSHAGPASVKPAERAREAERLLRQALAYELQGTNVAHWRTSDLRSRLGGAVLSAAFTDPALTPAGRQAKLAEAGALLLEGHAGIPPRKSSAKAYKRDALERLVRFYDALDQPAQAAHWRAQPGL
jgi:tetratricopeptide (TPR) repeat protein